VVRAVRVAWPGGAREEFRGVQAGRGWRLEQGKGAATPLELPRVAPLAASPVESVPVPSVVRVPLVRPVPLPRLSLASADGSELALFGIQPGGSGQGTGRPILLSLFSTTCAPCASELGALAARAGDFERVGLAPLAVSVEPVAERARAGEFLAQRGWPFPWAVASGETLDVLDALAASVLDTETRLTLPASFLIDAGGALRVLYRGPAGADQVLADRALCDLGDGALFDAASPFPGRWMFPGLPSDADFFERRLQARGLTAAAAEFARGRLTVVRSAPADLLADFGRRAAVEGRLEEAEGYYRRALAADPRHFGSLADWAVVLHRQERLAEAAELYGKALAIRPDDADMRFNLALARFQLGDRAFAEQQLRWLEARGAEAAAVLRQILTAPAADK
jgi:peroxiredoxin